MKIGDEIVISDRNPNHLGYGVSGYARMKGILTEIWDDNGFAIDCGGCSLVVPMVIYGKPKIYWIWVNGELKKHRGIKYSTNILKEEIKKENTLIKLLELLKKYYTNYATFR
jgi:hypothetical protein